MDEPDKNLIPTSFKTQIGGYFGRSYSVAKEDDQTLLYVRRPDGFGSEERIEEQVPVTISQWARFREAIDGVNIWEWESSYMDPSVMDGTSWRVEIGFADASVKSGGSNAYPPEFRAYLKAVEELLGARDFR